MGSFGMYSDKKDKKDKSGKTPWWSRGWGRGGWGGSSWDDDLGGDGFGTGTDGYSDYSYPSYYSGERFKAIYDRDKIFSDKSTELQKKCGGVNKKKIEDYLIPNKYSLSDFSGNFHGCLYWVKDLEDTDKKLMELFGKQAKTVISFVNDGIYNPSVKLAQEGSHVSYSGDKMEISVASMYDWRLSKEDRIDIFYSDMLHETFHLKHTLPEYATALVRAGHVKKKINRWGRLIDTPNFEEQLFSDAVHGRLFNIIEDRRIEKKGLGDHQGYAGYFDKSYAYYAWLTAPMIAKEFVFDEANKIAAFLINYIHVRILLPNVVDDFMKANVNYKTFTKKINTVGTLEQTINLIDKLLGGEPKTFLEAFELSKKLRDLIPLPPGSECPGGEKGCLPGKIVILTGGDASDIEGAIDDGQSESTDAKDSVLVDVGDPKTGGKAKPKISLPAHKNVQFVSRGLISAATIYYEKPDENRFDGVVYRKALELSKCFRKDLDFLNSKFTATEEAYELNSGDLDEDDLATIKFNKNVFTEDDPAKEYSLDLGLLMDESGSMGCGDKIRNAQIGALALYLAFIDKPNIDMFVYGHTAQENANDSVEMYRYYDKTKRVTDINGIFSVKARHENMDGFAILEMGKILDRGKNASKMLIVLSDGIPAAGGYGGDKGIEHTRLCVEELERRGIFVIEIAIDSFRGISRMFKHYVNFTDSKALGTDLLKVMHREFNKIGNTR